MAPAQFALGDVVRVVKVRPHLRAAIGDIGTVMAAYPGTSEDLIDVAWKDGYRADGLFADQFASVLMGDDKSVPMEDTREYLNAITDGTNV